MRGQILETSPAGGVILGDDGQRYRFMGTDWKGAGMPGRTTVDFVAVGERATEIYPLGAGGTSGEGNSVLLGSLGIGCLVLSFVFPILPIIAAFVLGLVGASSAKAHGNATGLTLSRIAWIGAVALTAIAAVLLIWFAAYAWPFFQLMWVLFLGAMQESTSA